MICCKCNKQFDDGYICLALKRVICINCEPKFKCLKHDHYHIRVPLKTDGENNGNIEIIEKYLQNGYIADLAVPTRDCKQLETTMFNQ